LLSMWFGDVSQCNDHPPTSSSSQLRLFSIGFLRHRISCNSLLFAFGTTILRSYNSAHHYLSGQPFSFSHESAHIAMSILLLGTALKVI